MSKPSWDNAPEWAQWLAADGDVDSECSFWVFFEEKPVFEEIHGGTWLGGMGKWLETDSIAIGFHGESTLEQRP